jgi:hypothetical protein
MGRQGDKLAAKVLKKKCVSVDIRTLASNKKPLREILRDVENTYAVQKKLKNSFANLFVFSLL